MYRKHLFALCLALSVTFLCQNAFAVGITNGDFSDPIIFDNGLGWESEDELPDSSIVSPADTNNVFVSGDEAVISNSHHSAVTSTLYQEIEVPTWAYSFSFEFSFLTEIDGSATDADSFPDWFQVSYYDSVITDGSYDRLFLGYDSNGAYDLYTHASVSLLDTINGVYRFEAIIASLSDRSGTLYFDLGDQLDGKGTTVTIDNVQINPIPEPTTFLMLFSGLACLAGMSIRHKKNLPA